MLMDLIVFVVAVVGVIVGADFIAKSSEHIARKKKISTYIISATLIALGTSLPEIATSVFASFKGHASLAVANVIGSTVFNTSFVVGIVLVLATRLHIKKDVFREDGLWIIAPLILFFVVAYDGVIDFFDGIVFVSLMVAFVLHLVKSNSLEEFADGDDDSDDLMPWGKAIGLLLVGFVCVIQGAHYTVESASAIALALGVSEWFVGIFFVSFGTSLPELAVSVVAVFKKRAEMLIGTIVGSNLANFSMVFGLSALVNDLTFSWTEHYVDIVMATASVLLFLFLTLGRTYNRSGGILVLSAVVMMTYHNLKPYMG